MAPSAISLFLIVGTVVLLAFDLYLAMDTLPGNTYSERMRKWTAQCGAFWVMAFIMGVLAGHWGPK